MGKSGAVRTNALDASQVAAMVIHEYRQDLVATARVVRNTPALVYSPYAFGLTDENPDRDLINQKIEELDRERHPSIADACEHHLFNIRQNKAARKLCLHSIIQYPTNLPITPETERQMLVEAVAFVNEKFGGDAVFHARLDRDEAGRHAVDVFYSPRYLKKTKRKSEHWVNLTKFGKELAEARFGKKEKKQKNEDTGEWDPVLDDDGNPVMVPCNCQVYQGRALQDAFYEHLRDKMHLDWVVRGERKVGRDPDRVEVEQHKFNQERKKRAAERHQEEKEAEVAMARLERLRAAVEALEDFEAWKAAEFEKDIQTAAELQAAEIMFTDSPRWTALAILAAGDHVDGLNGEYVGGWEIGPALETSGLAPPPTGMQDIRAVRNVLLGRDGHSRVLLDAELRRDQTAYAQWDEVEENIETIGKAWRRVGTWSRQLMDSLSGITVGLIKLAYDRLVCALVQERTSEIEAMQPPPEAGPLTQMPEEAQQKIRTAFADKKPGTHDP